MIWNILWEHVNVAHDYLILARTSTIHLHLATMLIGMGMKWINWVFIPWIFLLANYLHKTVPCLYSYRHVLHHHSCWWWRVNSKYYGVFLANQEYPNEYHRMMDSVKLTSTITNSKSYTENQGWHWITIYYAITVPLITACQPLPLFNHYKHCGANRHSNNSQVSGMGRNSLGEYAEQSLTHTRDINLQCIIFLSCR